MPEAANDADTAVVTGTFWARPNRGVGLVFAAAVVVEALGQLVKAPLLTCAAAALVGAIISAAAATPKLRGAELDWQLPDRLTRGIETQLVVRVTGSRRRPARTRSLTLTFDHPAFASTTVLVDHVGVGQTVRAVVPVNPGQRGMWETDGSLTAEVHSPLGGWVRRKTVVLPRKVIVHPAIGTPLSPPALTVSSGAVESASSGRRHASGSELMGLREWRSGDAMSTVHWRSSARRGQIVVAERELPSQVSLTVALIRHGDGEDWESSISQAAATAATTLRTGGRVTLLSAAGIVMPKTAREALDWFAAVDDLPTIGSAPLGNGWVLALDGHLL